MASFIHYKQLDSMDCGPTCLRMVARFYGKTYSLQYLRSLSYGTREGVSMLGISDAAENIGFRTRGFRLTWEQLRDEAPLPCIVHWNQKHFVVVYDIKTREKSPFFPLLKKKTSHDTGVVKIADPAVGLLTYTKEEFLKCWQTIHKSNEKEGVALLLEPTPMFYKHEDETKIRLKFVYLLLYLHPYRKFIFQLMPGMLTGSIIRMILPFLTQPIFDTGIGNSNLYLINPIYHR